MFWRLGLLWNWWVNSGWKLLNGMTSWLVWMSCVFPSSRDMLEAGCLPTVLRSHPAVIGTYWKYGMVRFPMITVAVRTMGRFCKAGGTVGLRLLVRWWHNLVLSESYGWNFAKVPYLSISIHVFTLYNEHCFWTKIWDFNINLAVNIGNPRVVGQLNPMNIWHVCFGLVRSYFCSVDIILFPIMLMLYLRFLKSWGYPQIIQVMDDHE
jgi:hypothetical protein